METSTQLLQYLSHIKMTSRIHEFDLVSDQTQIVGEITSTKRAYEKTFGDCIFLSKIEAKKKILVLTDRKFYRSFRSKYEGELPSDVEVLLVNLDEM